jgi:alpha-maltose-1-phosphate synthase
MRVAHILRKYNPAEWGGTETALERLFDGLEPEVQPVIYCPKIATNGHAGEVRDPFVSRGYSIRRFHACVPIWGLSREERERMVSVGGNIFSFELVWALWREPDIAVIHSHALGRLGGIALTIAKQRRLPFVVTIHGGFLDLPPALRRQMDEPGYRGVEWGKLFGAILNSRNVIPNADAILTCNEREAALLREKFPHKLIRVQPHGIPMKLFEQDHRRAALAAFPTLAGHQLVLVVGRVDPVKNQGWLLEQAATMFAKHPKAILMFAGACTDAEYGRALEKRIGELGLRDKVLIPGGFPPGDPRLIGLMQESAVVVLPSVSETFGLVILEAWAAGAPVISSRTSGGSALVRHGENGWLFDLEDPRSFHQALDHALTDPRTARGFASAGWELAREEFDTRAIAGQVRDLYQELAEKHGSLSGEEAVQCAT